MKKLFVLILTFTLMLMTAACFPTGSRSEENSAEPPASESVSDEVSDNSPTEPEKIKIEDPEPLYGEPEKLTRDMIPEHYEDKVNDTILISAEVIAPDNIEFGTVAAKKARYPAYEEQEDLVRIFMHEDYEHTHKDKEDNTDYFFDRYFSSNGNGEKLWLTNSNLDYDRNATEDGSNSFDYRRFCYGNAVSNDYLSRLNEFYTLENLDGIDKDWAVSLVKEKVDALSEKTGIKFVQEPEVYCFESESAREFFKTQYRLYGESPEEFSFPDENNAYFVYFRTAFFEMPVTGEFWYSSERSLSSPLGAYAYGIVDKEGLVRFCAYNGTVPVLEKPESENLYNVDVVKRALYDNYGEKKLPTMTVVTDIYLQYVCESDQSEQYYIYRPYWVCYIGKFDKENFSEQDVLKDNPQLILYVNALTGELLNTSDVNGTMRSSFF